jgi:hypothetical protein
MKWLDDDTAANVISLLIVAGFIFVMVIAAISWRSPVNVSTLRFRFAYE